MRCAVLTYGFVEKVNWDLMRYLVVDESTIMAMRFWSSKVLVVVGVVEERAGGGSWLK